MLKVETLIENAECGASSGAYIVNIRTRNEAGDANTQKHQETWSRADSQPVNATHTYSMNGDTELVKVRLKLPINDACVCQ